MGQRTLRLLCLSLLLAASPSWAQTPNADHAGSAVEAADNAKLFGAFAGADIAAIPAAVMRGLPAFARDRCEQLGDTVRCSQVPRVPLGLVEQVFYFGAGKLQAVELVTPPDAGTSSQAVFEAWGQHVHALAGRPWPWQTDPTSQEVAVWLLDRTTVRLEITRQNVVRMRLSGAPKVCETDALLDAMVQLHPPASFDQRQRAAEFLGHCHMDRAAPALIAALSAQRTVAQGDARAEAGVRQAQVIALGRTHTPEARNALVHVASSPTQDPTSRGSAIAALALQADVNTLRLIVNDVGQRDDVRAHALLSLAKVAGAEEAANLQPRVMGLALTNALKALKPPPPAPLPEVVAQAPAEPARDERDPAYDALLPPGKGSHWDDPDPPNPKPKPSGPVSGTPLTVTASIAAGALWGGSLSLLAQQDSPTVVGLLGTAGAVIGAGTAWGLTSFGVRPTVSQALWYTNTITWGSLAGLMAWSATGSDSNKLKYGFWVGGETLGVVAGIVTARSLKWQPKQIVFANSLLLGASLSVLGVDRLRGEPFGVPPVLGYGFIPLAVASSSPLIMSSPRALIFASCSTRPQQAR